MLSDKPYLRITYNGTNITEDVSKNLLTFGYTDSLEEADTLDIVLEDSALLWQGEWFPEKGASIHAEIGLEGGAILDCGDFRIDELEMSGPPDLVNIRCISAGFTEGKKRTKKSHVHEGKTLAEIIRTVAASCGLEVEGEISNIRIGRAVQRKQKDIRFLRRLASQYGYTFNVRGSKAIFMPTDKLEGATPVLTFHKEDLMNYSLRSQSVGTYSSATVQYHNPETGETITHTENTGAVSGTDDTLEVEQTAENKAQAMAMARAALAQANRNQLTGNISLPGRAELCSGNVITLEGLGVMSGEYMIQSSAHTIGVSEGWLVDAEIYKVVKS